MAQTFIRKQAKKITGIPPRRIEFYLQQGLLSGIDLKTGRGTARQFTKLNLFQLMVIKRLAAAGIELNRIEKFIKLVGCDNSPLFDEDGDIRKAYSTDQSIVVRDHRLILKIYDGGADGGWYIGAADERGLPPGRNFVFSDHGAVFLFDMTDDYKAIENI